MVQSIGEPRYPILHGHSQGVQSGHSGLVAGRFGAEPAAGGRQPPRVAMNPPAREARCEIITGESPEAITETLVEKILAEKVL